jgi:SAM-dependent methyltransferase
VRIDAFAPNADVRADFGSPLPFRDAAFDAVICTEVMEHVPDAAVLLAEIYRVLRPGGRMLCTVPFVFHFHADPADFRRLSPPGLARALEAQGFIVEFLSGLGGKGIAFLLLVDSLGLPARVALRALLAPIAPLFALRKPRAGEWSDYAANSVAIARRPS